jgi:hypothetical protein
MFTDNAPRKNMKPLLDSTNRTKTNLSQQVQVKQIISHFKNTQINMAEGAGNV